MNVLGDQLRCNEWAIRTSGERHAGDVAYAGERPRIGRYLLECLIAGHGSDGQQVNIGISPCQQHGDGIVMAGIAIQDDLARASVSRGGRGDFSS